MKTWVVFLGFVISKEGSKMDPKKIKAIMEWSYRRNVNEVRIFHGLSSLYRNFNKNFRSICVTQ